MSVFQMNQFGQGDIKGKLDRIFSAFTIPVQLDPDSVATLVPGDAVKLSGEAGSGPIMVEKCTAVDLPFAFVIYNPKKTSFGAGDSLEVALPGSVVVMEAGAAITQGHAVEFVVTGAKVITAVGQHRIAGLALNSAAGSGSLVRVMINTSLNQPFSVGSTVLAAGATPSLDASLGPNFTLTPAENETIAAVNIKAGMDVYLLVTTSGTSSFTLTFGSGFVVTGTLATGTVTAKKFLIHFHAFADGTLTEVSRTAAM